MGREGMNNYKLELGNHEQKCLFSLIERCHGAPSESDLQSSIYAALQELIPHNMFACGLGSTPDNRVLYFLNISFPEGYMKRVISGDGYLLSPVARHWLDNKKPVFYEVGTSAAGVSQGDSAWLGAIRDYGIQNIVAHGLSDIRNRAASYFSLGDVECWGEREQALFEVLVPHLHVVLLRLQPQSPAQPSLSKRESEILYWVCQGKSNSEIGEILSISQWTAKVHVRNVMAKLNVTSRAQAAAKAAELGLV